MKISRVFIFGTVLTLASSELFLHFYHPFETTLQGEHFSLKPQHRETLESKNPKIASLVEVQTNKLGLRGYDLEEGSFRVFTVGGSSTLSPYQGDGKTWTDLLGIELKKEDPKFWINNAGQNGHSTQGHLALLHEVIFPLKPDIVIFLLGMNDVGRKIETVEERPLPEFLMKSELVSLGANIYRTYHSEKPRLSYDLNWDPQKLSTKEMTGEELSRLTMSHSKSFLPFYRRRLEALVRACKENKVDVMLVTQPLVYGELEDPTTKVRLDKIRVGEENSLAVWLVLELYNDVTRIVARREKVALVDLARLLPKDSSLFLDPVHFSDAGAEKVKEILLPELKKVILKRKAN